VPLDTLDRIPAEKRDRILAAAAAAFAERGYAQTDIALIARAAGVAKGSMYNYFESKEALYRHVCSEGLRRSRAEVWGGVRDDWDVYQVLRHLFERGALFACEHPEFVALYLEIGSSGMATFAGELTYEVERPTAEKLAARLEAGVAAGAVRADLDVRQAAYLINGTYILFMSSLVSVHFGVRMRAYFDMPDPLTDEAVANHIERTLSTLALLLKPC